MKRKMSVKLRLTLWFTAFMAIIAVVCLALILIITGNISRRDASEKLDSAVRTNIANLEYSSGKLNLKSGFEFYRDDVYTVIYNNSRSVLGGETPHGFNISEPLENGVIKNVYGDGDSFTVFDLFVPSGWDDGVWVRGIMLTPDVEDEALKSVRVFGIMLPFIILLAAAGGYLMIRRAMRPIERLKGIADSISDGKDLKYDIPEELEGYDETGRLARAFRLMVGRLEESFEAEKQFVSDASHELRTPTAVIGTQCDYLDKYADSVEDYKEGVEVIRRQNDRMRKLIERLLDMTRLDFGTKKLELKDTDLSELFKGQRRVVCEHAHVCALLAQPHARRLEILAQGVRAHEIDAGAAVLRCEVFRRHHARGVHLVARVEQPEPPELFGILPPRAGGVVRAVHDPAAAFADGGERSAR